LVTYLQAFILTVALIAPAVTPDKTAPTGPAAKPDLAVMSLLEAPKNPPLPQILKNIAWCESRDRHYGKDGKIIRGTRNYYDIGKYQINLIYWGEEAKKQGHNIFSEAGNEAMALAMYERYGTQPWKWSKACWSDINLAANK
jgi:hypothetical protein